MIFQIRKYLGFFLIHQTSPGSRHPGMTDPNMSNAAGGRMSTNRQEVNGATVRADMGAQFLVRE